MLFSSPYASGTDTFFTSVQLRSSRPYAELSFILIPIRSVRLSCNIQCDIWKACLACFTTVDRSSLVDFFFADLFYTQSINATTTCLIELVEILKLNTYSKIFHRYAENLDEIINSICRIVTVAVYIDTVIFNTDIGIFLLSFDGASGSFIHTASELIFSYGV